MSITLKCMSEKEDRKVCCEFILLMIQSNVGLL